MNVARATTAVSASSPIAAAAGNLAQQGNALIAEYGREQTKQQENIAATQSANILSEADVYWQQNTTERFKAFKVGDGDLRETR